MDLSYFHLHRYPFERDIPVDELFPFKGFEEARARLRYSVERHTLSVLTGEVGCGKSTVLRALVASLPDTRYRFIYISDRNLTERAFYDLILTELGVIPDYLLIRMKRQFREAVEGLVTKGVDLIIAIDEAHELSHDMFQEIRYLFNFEIDSSTPFSLILVGEPQMRSTLRLRSLQAVFRRVEVQYHLTGMEQSEIKPYIVHELKMAGCDRPLFPDDVIDRIYEYSKGAIWLVARLCKACLMDAYTHRQQLVDSGNLKRVMEEITL
ncbi:MAG TPA: AAA family ATPase [Firmicutes bacterium]|nr:AAA family ATPase [Bacillota bacterium]